MRRVNVTLDEVTERRLARIGELYGIAERSAVVRFIAALVARQEGIEEEVTAKEATAPWEPSSVGPTKPGTP